MKNLQLGFIIICFGTGLVQGAEKLESSQPVFVHDSSDCGQCHSQSSTRNIGYAATSRECLSCHPEQFSSRSSELGFHGNQAQDRCLQCHSYHESAVITTARGAIDLNSLGQINTAHCQSCHNGKGTLESLSEAHLVAANLYHEQAASLKNTSPSQACLNCHSNTSATDWQLANSGDILEFSEHATHPIEVSVVPGQGSLAHRIRRKIDPDIPLFDQEIQCQTCHQLNSEETDLLVTLDDGADLCLGCHQFKDQPADQREQFVATISSR